MAEVIHIRVNRTMCILSGSLLFISGFIHNYFGYKEGYLLVDIDANRPLEQVLVDAEKAITDFMTARGYH